MTDSLLTLLSEALGRDLSGAAPMARLVEDLGFDSLAVLEIVVALELCGLRWDRDVGPRTLGDLMSVFPMGGTDAR